ncbi:hypothetical protein AFB00_25670 [Pseudonocardia sp. HH130630-07]|nr:hypothetical protein AFB00_25670 [Pseudonocardia sp. HH130630-07]
MVPTEYIGINDSPYKKTLRETLDERIVVQWTGIQTVATSIKVADAQKAAQDYGRKLFLWDNYPVNDFQNTAGRLLLAPYDKREAGLSEALNGIVLNPMNQASPSKLAIATGASFAWNDAAYDAGRTWRATAAYLADWEPLTTMSLLAFLDTQHLAPGHDGDGTKPWQPQAPALAAKLDAVRANPSGEALEELTRYAGVLAAAPERIRSGVADKAFSEQAKPWLDATGLWGQALQATADGLAAQDPAVAQERFAEANRLAVEAGKITTIPEATVVDVQLGVTPVKVADGVLDTFIAEAPGLVT